MCGPTMKRVSVRDTFDRGTRGSKINPLQASGGEEFFLHYHGEPKPLHTN